MPTDDDLDPGAPTAMFQAFVDRDEYDQETKRGWVTPVLAVVVALAVAVALVWYLLG